jgi:hypothetical protein
MRASVLALAVGTAIASSALGVAAPAALAQQPDLIQVQAEADRNWRDRRWRDRGYWHRPYYYRPAPPPVVYYPPYRPYYPPPPPRPGFGFWIS